MDQEPKVRDGRWWKITSSVQCVPDEEIFEDTKGVIRIRKWNKDRQHSKHDLYINVIIYNVRYFS
jgi:hypothetical protein